MNLFHLYARVTLDTGDYEDGVKKSVSLAEKMKKGFSAVTKTASILSAAVGAAGTIVSKVGIEAAADARAMESQFSQAFGDMAGSAEDAVTRVANASGIVSSRLKTAASSVYSFARASGGEIAESMSIMERSLQVAADAAAYYDRSLEDTTATLQSFLKGNFENDAALGLSATETTRNAAAMELFGQKFKDLTEIQKQQTLLQMVEDAQALSGAMGQAAREASGWENIIGNLKRSWTDLTAAFGTPLLDTITPIIQNATEKIQQLQATVNWDAWAKTVATAFENGVARAKELAVTISELVPAVELAAGSFVSLKAGMAIQSAVQGFQKAQVAVSLLTLEVGKANLAQSALNGTLTIGETIVALLTGKMSAAALAQGAMTKAQTALNAVLNANPIGIVITALGALATALVVLYNENEDFRNNINASWASIKESISNAVSAISTFFTETIPNAAQKAVDWFEKIPSQMREIGSDLLTGLWSGISDKVEWLKGKVFGVVETIKSCFTGKEGFDEHSPSKWANQVFRYVMEGGAEGIVAGTPSLLRSVDSVVGQVKNGVEIGSVDFGSSALGITSAENINAINDSSRNQSISVVAKLVLEDGHELASFILDDLIRTARANGTPIANPSTG